MTAEADFDEFYRARAPGLSRALHLAFGDVGRAEDATQEAFVKAWQRWPRLDTDPISWTRRVAWHLYIDDWRRSKRRIEREQRTADDESVCAPEIDEALLLLEPLGPGQRAVMILHYVEDMDVADVAQLLDIPIGTVKSRMSRAREILRAAAGTEQQ